MKTKIFETLEQLGMTSFESREVFNSRTRDVEGLTVWRDAVSGVIYIDEFYTGNNTYVGGEYRDREALSIGFGKADYEQHVDNERRYLNTLKFISGKNILDFGCGAGNFLRLAQSQCETVYGVELQQNFADQLNSEGIRCVTNLCDIDDGSIDVCVSFHVIEHLPDPLTLLSEIKAKLKPGGTVVLEVPHANDFLLSPMVDTEPFKQITLWRQHLILHTRESLYRMLNHVGFENIQIEGVQRYPLSNHLNWLVDGKPGGHKSAMGQLDTPALIEAYTTALARLDKTDTLVAVAKMSSR